MPFNHRANCPQMSELCVQHLCCMGGLIEALRLFTCTFQVLHEMYHTFSAHIAEVSRRSLDMLYVHKVQTRRRLIGTRRTDP